MPAISPLADVEFAKLVAQAFADGESRNSMAEMFDRAPATITEWRRDPRVKVHVFKLLEDRILQVTRKVDGVIAMRLEQAERMTIAELLAVRKEFLGGQLRAGLEKADQETIDETTSWIESHPDAVEQLEELLKTGKLTGSE